MTTYIRTVVVIMTLTAAGCAIDLRLHGSLEKLEGGAFKWRTLGTPAFPADSEDAEQARREALEIVLSENALCSHGYVIDHREVTIRDKGPFGNLSDIFYRGHCTG